MDTNKTFQMGSLADHGANLKILFPHPLVAKLIDGAVNRYGAIPKVEGTAGEIAARGVVADRLTIQAGHFYRYLKEKEKTFFAVQTT